MFIRYHFDCACLEEVEVPWDIVVLWSFADQEADTVQCGCDIEQSLSNYRDASEKDHAGRLCGSTIFVGPSPFARTVQSREGGKKTSPLFWFSFTYEQMSAVPMKGIYTDVLLKVRIYKRKRQFYPEKEK